MNYELKSSSCCVNFLELELNSVPFQLIQPCRVLSFLLPFLFPLPKATITLKGELT